MKFLVTVFNGKERQSYSIEAENANGVLNEINTTFFNQSEIKPMIGKDYLSIAFKQPWISISYEGNADTPHKDHAEQISKGKTILYVEHYLVERRKTKRNSSKYML